MHPTLAVFASLAAAGIVSASPNILRRQSDNPFEGRQLSVNSIYSEALEVTRESFLEANDAENAGKIQFVQEQVGSFTWISNIASLEDIDNAIQSARAQESNQEQIVGLVLYNLPGRDCSAGESSGELHLDQDGLRRYKSEYIDKYAEKVLNAPELQFAIVVEPDAVANMITGQDIELCANAAEAHREGIAYAIQQLQSDNIHLYVDAANGGWLGEEDSITAAASEFASIVKQANNGAIRGFSTNVSNYNAFTVSTPEDITDGSDSYDESHYVSNLASALEAEGLPTRFIVDQGRVAVRGAREEWGEWCNVEAGFGQPPTTETDNANVDSIVWVKPGGESDGECGMEGAPIAGSWFDEYAQMLAINAHPDIQSVSSSD